MLTHKRITDRLERNIVANALWNFRTLTKKGNEHFKWYIFASFSDDFIPNSCKVDVEAWKLVEISFNKVVGNKVKWCTINLN